MNKNIISLLLLLACALGSSQVLAQPAQIKSDAPDRYTVERGDTLWGISGRFLEKPWNWPQLWNMNRDQIRNPHRIYPGDVLVLDRASGSLRVVSGDTVRLSPGIRSEAISRGIPTIPPTAIDAFLTRPLVVTENELDAAPFVFATQEDRVALGTGNIAYIKGITKDKGTAWQIFRRGDRLVDPDSGETLGYVALYLGEARVREFGPVSTVEITKSTQEIYVNDRLIAVTKETPVFAYVPRAPDAKVTGRVISTYEGLTETGPLSVVSLSKGTKDGIQVGHVLAIHRSSSASRYTTRMSPIWGSVGPTGNDSPRTYYGTKMTPRDGAVFGEMDAITPGEINEIPDERYGLVMVFRTFDRASFGLVMQASRPVAISDVIKNP